MSILRTTSILAATVLLSMNAVAQVADYGQENGVLSFENGTSPAVPGSKSRLAVSDLHAKLGTNSLLWEWKRPGATISIPGTVPYLKENPDPKETSVSTFVFMVYSDCPKEGALRFSFMKEGRECCHFEYGLDFTGWRGAWVAFDRDMQGCPEEGMDEVVITAPENIRKGRLWFDGIITSSFQDVRHHTPDWQAPFINKNTTVHWLVLNNSWNLALDIAPEDILSSDNLSDIRTITERFEKLVKTGGKVWDMKKIRSVYDSYGISLNPDGTIKGKPIWFTRFGETFINLGIKDAKQTFKANGQLLRQYNDNLFQIARAYKACNEPAAAKEIADIYVMMTRHLLDQGFAAGSALGTLHHLGYSMRNFYTAPVLMMDVLRDAGLSEEVQRAMEWFSGVGEVKTAPCEPGMDIDAFNTSLMGRMASLLMLEDTPYKMAYLKALSRWIDNGFNYADGTKPCFKTDGTIYHHRKCYPAYAVGGLDGAVNAVWMLRGTSLAVSEKSHRILKESLLAMRFYCNMRSFPLAMSGRHPDGKGSLEPKHFALLADAGSPDGSSEIDRELASAYLRLAGGKPDKQYAKRFAATGVTAETAPQGSRAFNFNCSLSHRYGESLVTMAGHSRYLWAAEIYNQANHYGRYLTHGSMQILSDAVPEPDSFGSGFQVDGWDWCHIPGATAAEIPMEKMKAVVLNVDEYSGYEEMLLSDEWFAGAVSHRGLYGLFAMKLHEHDKYNGSLRARKSYFTFGNRVVALGSDLENTLPDSHLHTTLFQNTVTEDTPTVVNGISFGNIGWETVVDGPLAVISDRFGNVWFVRNSTTGISRKIQHSLHEETDARTEGIFEKAWIQNDCKDSYEYLTVVKASDRQIAEYTAERPYKVVRQDRNAHVVKDLESGVTGCAVFEEGAVDSLILHSSPALLMYSCDGQELMLSACNPDLALYSGESDEIYGPDGKRLERSVYGRSWIDNPCAETVITIQLDGSWEIKGECASDVTISHEGMRTRIVFSTREAATEEIVLKRTYNDNI